MPTTTSTRLLLAALRGCGLDRLYQQLDCELGVILTFHRVSPTSSQGFAPNAHLSIEPDFVRAVIDLLRRRGFDLVSIDEAARRIRAGECGRRFASLTFDDGYRDMMDHALPVLHEEEVPYTVYIAPGLISGTARLWWEDVEALIAARQRLTIELAEGLRQLRCSTEVEKGNTYRRLVRFLTQEVPEDHIADTVERWFREHSFKAAPEPHKRMMNWNEINAISANPLCTLGAHTIDHPALARLDVESAKAEMKTSVSLLEEITGSRPQHFAYPYGYPEAAGPREFELARECGFDTAVTTRPGMIFPEHTNHMMALPRVSVNGRYQSLHYLSPLITGLPTRMRQRFRRLDVA